MLHTTLHKSIKLTSALVLVGTMMIAFPLSAGAIANDTLKDQLVKQAQRKIDTEYSALITGNTAEVTKPTQEISGLAAEKKNTTTKAP